MALAQSVIHTYQSSQVQSAPSGRLVVLAYNGLISSLIQAKQLIEAKPACTNGDATWIEKSHVHLSKSMMLLTELIKGLNFKQGGDIAKNLYALYIYMYELITAADMTKEKEGIDKTLNFLIPLRDAFEEADKVHRKDMRRQKAGA